MARYIGPVCKLCRREGMKLFLKGERCYTEKCAYTRRPYPPGQHGQARVKLSEYAIRLREKQKVRKIYGVLERQFQRYYFDATRRKGRTGEQMLGLLESRLDNVVHRLGFAFTRSQARQVVRHGHVLVNSKRVDIPSVILRAGDKIEIRQKSREIKEIAASLAQVDKRPVMSWLELDKANFIGTFKFDSGTVRRRVLLTLRYEEFYTGWRRAPLESGFEGALGSPREPWRRRSE
jgi:small subunit ribosomal protein S4